ncbi:hypothetical protein FG386_001030 [Cryptosporidium ryanae]|uniref:uncharacterized protein n=1 Tax=Cryptosporidium ryanae TaxID=515981 RepID=UPI00351A056C|nr:hypothetical protein FG386_001030 [Cryptosporidium ryanae]
MTIFVLYVKADFEGIEELIFPENYTWCVDIEQSAGPLTREKITIDPNEKIEMDNSRGTANYVMRWDSDKRQSTISCVKLNNISNMKVTFENSGKFVPIAAFDCRGINITKWNPTFGYVAVSNSGKKFDNIDLSELEWCDFDENTNESVGIYNITSELRVHKT